MANVTPKKKVDSIGGLIRTKRGNISAVARALKLPRNTVYRQIEADPELKTALQDAREEMLDTAEDKLGGAIRKGEPWAVCFTLKTQGQSRGYVEKQKMEHSGPEGKPIQTQYIVEIVKNDGNNTATDKN